MTDNEQAYLNGVRESLEAVSVALIGLQDQIDCLLADIASQEECFPSDEISRKCGFDQ